MKQPIRERWFTVTGCGQGGPSLTFYSGISPEEAELAKITAVRSGMQVEVQEVQSYAPPERQPQCVCRGNPVAQMMCPVGHLTECHYPLECCEAVCEHFLIAQRHGDDPEIDDSPAPEGGQRILPDDILHEGGTGPQTPCSRCGKVLGERLAIRVWPSTGGEYAFHPQCLNMTVFSEDRDEDLEDNGF